MASAFNQSSSTSGPVGSGQSTTVTSIPTHQMLNHTLPVKLDRSNYVLWRSQIDYVVFVNGFEDFIDGTTICPEKELSLGVTNPLFVAWRRQDSTILSWIYSSLMPAIMAQIIDYNTSHTTWNALEKTFSSSSKARIMQLRLELQSMKKGSLSMIDYIIKVKGAADNLATIGELVLEQDQIMNLLRGLKSDYNAVVTAINIRDDKIFIEAVHKVVEESTMAAEDKAIPQIPATTPIGVVIVGVGITIMGDTIQPTLKSHNVNYVASLVILPMCVTIASHHLTQNEGNLNNFAPYTGTDRVTVGNAQNRRAKRKHKHVMETGLALLSHASLLIQFWQYAFQSATFLINRMPSKDTCSAPAPRLTTRLMYGITKKKTMFHISATKLSKPHTLSQALTDSNWTQAMDLEIAALHKNHTWDLVDQPTDVNIIGCKWVYKLKHKPNRIIDRYKARLVVKGFHQTLDLDYFETFSPTVKAATI
ncbi:uncharacterized protein [Populus alba]|uniref:uncharacterized protein n=1 Tax=Populus alba TaxID=43335 RepID=UPI003CC7742C